MTIALPPCYHIDISKDGNVIRQLASPAWVGEGVLEPLVGGRLRGFHLKPSDATHQVLLLTNTSRLPDDEECVLRVRGEPAIDGNSNLSSARWERHPLLSSQLSELSDFERNIDTIIASWDNAFAYKRENVTGRIDGLRPPQIGALYAVQAHWTVNSDPATVVLPTGVGKTETMLSILVAERCRRMLVIVPTDALRTQLFDKFVTLGLLKSSRFQVIADHALYPVVGRLSHTPPDTASLESYVKKCNVVVTTMALAVNLSEEMRSRLSDLCPVLFIDEAHHVAAPRWSEFKQSFSRSRIVQFTATPFRNDNKPVDGRRIFTFTLKQAQEQEYFKQINFRPVKEFDPGRMDEAIAEAAVEQLRIDADKGHILMARVENISRAEEVFACYQKYPEFNPVQIHSGIKSKTEREETRHKLLSGESRIVVCVDMLGEGFDLPELKIAAFHDIKKSLAITLQLAGRFTRAKPHLGNATFVANIADLDVKDELRSLYQHDSDWNALLPLFNEAATTSDASLWEFLRGFQELPEDITLQNVRPAMSTVVYRTKGRDWTPENFDKGIPGYDRLDKVYHSVNPHEKTLVIVTTRRAPIEWAQIDEIHTWDWQLYVLHWDQSQNLLYIHNSSNSGFFKRLAEAVAGTVELVEGPDIFRSLASINRLKLQNVGLREQLGRLIRYTMRAGCDVEPAMSEAQKRKAIKSNLFGQGYENGSRTTIGCSYKGRIWSMRTTNLMELIHWCRSVGAKLNDQTLNPEEVLAGTLVPKIVSDRPAKSVVAVEWPDLFYRQPERTFEFQIDGKTSFLHAADLRLLNYADQGPLSFALITDSIQVTFEQHFSQTDGSPDFSIRVLSGNTAILRHGSKTTPLTDFFADAPPTFWFADGSSLAGIEYVELRRQPIPFPGDRIDAWNWKGTDLRNESQGIGRDPASIQYRVIAELKRRTFNVIFDDDDHGESADVVAIIEQPDCLEIEFWHCKYSAADDPGRRIRDLYEVCGQAQKSVKWLEKTTDLFTHLMKRSPRKRGGQNGTRYELGTESDLFRIRKKAERQRVFLKIYIVQPGLSKTHATRDQLELLAVTENYLLETFAVPLLVIGSP